jgi:hypothetical protein
MGEVVVGLTLDDLLVDTDGELVLVLSVDGGAVSVGFVVALDVVPLLLLDDSVVCGVVSETDDDGADVTVVVGGVRVADPVD